MYLTKFESRSIILCFSIFYIGIITWYFIWLYYKNHKFLYGISKIDNHWFVTYHLYHKEKFAIIEATYYPCCFFTTKLWKILEIETNNILVLADNNYSNIEKDVFKSAKIMPKDKTCYISIHLIKLCTSQIKYDLNRIFLLKKTLIREIFLINNAFAGYSTSRELSENHSYSGKT